MEELRRGATLADIQRYVAELETQRGFADQTAVQKCLLMGEEMGELFKAVRKREGLPIDCEAGALPIADELADLIIYLCAVANRYGVDLEEAFRAKERVNMARNWMVAAAPAS